MGKITRNCGFKKLMMVIFATLILSSNISDNVSVITNVSHNTEASTKYKKVRYKGILFAIPTYFSEKDDDAEGVDFYYYPKEKEEYASLCFFSAKVKNASFNRLKDVYRKHMKKFGTIDNEHTNSLDGIKTYTVSLKPSGKKKAFSILLVMLYKNHCTGLLLSVDDSVNTKYDYAEDFYKIIKKSKKVPVKTKTKATPKPTPKQNDTYVLITETGSCYHVRKCGNGTYFQVTLNYALSKGLRPCKKCYR